MAEKVLCKSDDSREISFEASSLLLAMKLLQILPPDFCLKAPTTQFKPFLVSPTFEKTTLARQISSTLSTTERLTKAQAAPSSF